MRNRTQYQTLRTRPTCLRLTGPDTPHKKQGGINKAISNAGKLGDNNNLEPHYKAFYLRRNEDYKLTSVFGSITSSTSESTRIEFDEKVLLLPSNTPAARIRDPQREVEAYFV